MFSHRYVKNSLFVLKWLYGFSYEMYDRVYFPMFFFSRTENMSKNSYTNKAQETVIVCLNEERTENKLSPLGRIS